MFAGLESFSKEEEKLYKLNDLVVRPQYHIKNGRPGRLEIKLMSSLELIFYNN